MNNNVYIMNIEAKDIFKQVTGEDGYKNMNDWYIDKKDNKKKYMKFSKLYSGSISESQLLEHLDLNKKFKIKKIIKNDNIFYWTDAIINLKFNYKNDDTEEVEYKSGAKVGQTYKRHHETNSEQMREYFYENGFKFNNKIYIEFGRTSSKSRGGYDLFILKDLYEDAQKYVDMGLTFRETDKLDVASTRAYEMLCASELKEGFIDIDVKTQMLLINDIDVELPDNCYVTTFNGTNCVTVPKENYIVKNKIFDGECLLDKSYFEGQSIKLLRNHWFKSDGICTDIQQFFIDNEITKVTDMFGRELNAKDIKIICTPSSIKFLKLENSEVKCNGKYVKRFLGDTEFDRQKSCYLYWLDHAEPKFGVVMSEEESQWTGENDYYNQLSYQMLNSCNCSFDELKDLCKEEFDYILQMKNDINVFKNYIGAYDLSPTREFVWNMLSVNEDFQYTNMFKTFKNNTINDYKDMLRTGKIKLKNIDYSVVIGNPMEMLYWSIGKDITKDNKYLGKEEVYCSRYEEGEELFLIRNPHVCSNNLFYAKNKKCDDFDKYFNFGRNVIVVDAIYNNIQFRLQGMDYDVDKVLCGTGLLVNHAKEARKLYTPVNKVDSMLILKEWTAKNKAIADAKIATGGKMIGQIINLSQELQSVYFTELKKKNSDKDLLDFLNLQVNTLSNISNISIDQAKKTFDERLKLNDELDLIRNCTFNGERILKNVVLEDGFKINKKGYVVNSVDQKIDKTLEVFTHQPLEDGDIILKRKPLFFRNAVIDEKQLKNYYFEKTDCTMDILQDVLSIKQKGTDYTKVISILDCIDWEKIDTRKANRHQIDTLHEGFKEYNKQLEKNKSDYKKCADGKAKSENIKARKLIISDELEELSKLKITKETIGALLKKAYENDERITTDEKTFNIRLFGYIYKTHRNTFEELFKEIKVEPKPIENNIIVWGKKINKNFTQN